MTNFHEELIARENAEINDPLNGKRFAMRKIMNSFGVGSSFTKAKSPKEFQEATKTELRDLAEYNRINGLLGKEIETEMDL